MKTEHASNLLIKLHRWAHRQDENFTTEAFVHLITSLLDLEHQTAIVFLSKLTNDFLHLSQNDLPLLEINTQVQTDEGKPDIEIRMKERLVYIEIKVDSKLGHDQLERYRKALETSEISHTFLVLLTRYAFLEGSEKADFSIQWYHIADWLQDILPHIRSPQASFLTQQFIEFLQLRHMTVNVVEGEIANSIRCLTHLNQERKLPRIIRRLEQLTEFEELIPLHNVLMMLNEILAQSHFASNAKLYSGKHRGGWLGFTLENLTYFIGFYYNDPEHLTFDTYSLEIDKQKYQQVKQGNLFTTNKRLRWENKLNFTSPAINFYNHTKEQQMNILTNFFKSSYEVTELIKK